jgi:hypothetical protein
VEGDYVSGFEKQEFGQKHEDKGTIMIRGAEPGGHEVHVKGEATNQLEAMSQGTHAWDIPVLSSWDQCHASCRWTLSDPAGVAVRRAWPTMIAGTKKHM